MPRGEKSSTALNEDIGDIARALALDLVGPGLGGLNAGAGGFAVDLQEGGAYAELWKRQTGGFLEAE